jgi:hypothetical protein
VNPGIFGKNKNISHSHIKAKEVIAI